MKRNHSEFGFARFGFSISSDDCELLLDFSASQSLTELAQARKRDISVVSRQINQLAKRFPVLEKSGRAWQLTSLGRQIVHWSQQAILNQREILKNRTRITIATSHEFAARVLAPGLNDLQKAAPHTLFSIHSTNETIESLLLSGEADFGFYCGRPLSPLVRFRMIQEEPVGVVCSPGFYKKHRVESLDDLLKLPCLRYQRMPPEQYFELDRELAPPSAEFNTIASTRAAAEAGLGWALLPLYSVGWEVSAKKLALLRLEQMPRLEKYGVWWLRGNHSTAQWVDHAMTWLKTRRLG